MPKIPSYIPSTPPGQKKRVVWFRSFGSCLTFRQTVFQLPFFHFMSVYSSQFSIPTFLDLLSFFKLPFVFINCPHSDKHIIIHLSVVCLNFIVFIYLISFCNVHLVFPSFFGHYCCLMQFRCLAFFFFFNIYFWQVVFPIRRKSRCLSIIFLSLSAIKVVSLSCRLIRIIVLI